METDLQLMFSNATAFNEPGSQIYKDARYAFRAQRTPVVLKFETWCSWYSACFDVHIHLSSKYQTVFINILVPGSEA